MEVVGRSAELARLDRFVQSESAEPRALVLDGEAGIGKSTLWLVAVDMTHAQGARVLVLRPTETEQALAFTGLGDLFEGVVDEVLPSLSPPRRRALEAALLLGEPVDRVDPRAVGVAVRDALQSLAVDARLVIAIDDVQWLDASSSAALAFALRRLQAPILFLFARRLGVASEGSELVGVLPADAVEPMHVGGLSLGAIQRVLRDQLGRVFAHPTVLRIHTASAGNPFYALEIARVLGAAADPAKPLPLPERLDELMTQRIAGLPEETNTVLGLVAAEGDPPLAVLRAAGVTEAAMEPAFTAGVLDAEGDKVRFSHPLLATAAYRRLSGAERRRFHGLLAEIVADPLRRARHLALSVEGDEPEVAATLDQAAEVAYARGAVAAAAELRDHALRLTPAVAEDDRHRRTIALARAALANANPARADELIDDLLDHTESGPRRAEALRLRFTGSADEFVAMLRAALDQAVGDAKLQAEIHAELAWCLTLTGRPDDAMHHASAAVSLAQQLNDRRLLAVSLSTLAFDHQHRGETDAIDIANRAFELTLDLDDPIRAEVAFRLMGTTLSTGHHERIRVLLEPLCIEWAERDELLASGAMWGLALVEFFAGNFRAAAKLAGATREIQLLYGDFDEAGTLYPMALVAAHRGNLDEARQLAANGLRATSRLPWQIPQFEGILGRVDQWSGDPDRACEHFAAAERTTFTREPGMTRWRADYAEALLALGRVDEAIALIDAWEHDARRLDRAVVVAEGHRCRGLIAVFNGDLATAEATLAQAADEHAKAGDPFGRARDLLALGTVRRRARKKRASRDAIEESIAVFDKCGAEGWAAKAHTELGRLGGRRRHEGLSPAEQRVANLAARGRTNREIAAEMYLSERTVESHLSHVYAKLGIRSRTELARTVGSDH